MQIITAYNQTITVEPQGAALLAYTRHGRDVLYQRRMHNGKLRGGSHVCVPNFGPGGTSDQPQHGLGRTVTWRCAEQLEDRIRFVYRHTSGMYDGLQLSLLYGLKESGLVMQLTVHNSGTYRLRVAPGFHPYFMVPLGHDGRIWIDETMYETSQLGEMKLHKGGPQVMLTIDEATRYRISTDVLQSYALWSAQPERYLCVEPTLAGNAFDESDPVANQVIVPGETKTYTIAIEQA